MSRSPERKRFAFRPTVTEASLEGRLVLSSGAGTITAAVGSPQVMVVTPPTELAPAGVTPAPAPSPIGARAAARALHPMTLAQVRKDYRTQVRVAARDLRTAIQTQVGQLYANGATPTAQQLADFNASVAGARDATALRLSAQAALLPNSGTRLVPAIQNAILGSGPRSLASRLTALAQSGQLSGTTGASARALTRLLNTSTVQTNAQLNNFFNTTPVNRLSVNSAGQRIPLGQFIGGQILNQAANTFGALAQSFPTVANSMLFPNGATGTPTQAALNAFTSQSGNALGTAAFVLGSDLSLFPNTSSVVTQLQPMLFGAANGTGTATTNAINSLAATLGGLQFGSTGFNTAVSNAFGTAFQSLATPIAQFFGITGPTNTVLPTSGLTSLFGTPFTGSSFFNGFNNGFATGTNTGFIGFGMTPTAFNTSFGTGFNNSVTSFNTGLGFNQLVGAGSGVTGIGSGTNTGIGSGTITGTGGGIV